MIIARAQVDKRSADAVDGADPVIILRAPRDLEDRDHAAGSIDISLTLLHRISGIDLFSNAHLLDDLLPRSLDVDILSAIAQRFGLFGNDDGVAIFLQPVRARRTSDAGARDQDL